MGPRAVPVPPNLIHSPASLEMNSGEGKGRGAPSLRKHIREFTQIIAKSKKHAGARKIKYEDWEKSSFQPCPASWCDSSKSYEVYVPATSYPDLPPGRGQVKAGKGVRQMEEAIKEQSLLAF